MIPEYERRVSDLLKTVTLGSAGALDEVSVGGTHGASPPEKSRAMAAGGGARPTAESPDDRLAFSSGLLQCRRLFLRRYGGADRRGDRVGDAGHQPAG